MALNIKFASVTCHLSADTDLPVRPLDKHPPRKLDKHPLRKLDRYPLRKLEKHPLRNVHYITTSIYMITTKA